MRKTGTKIMSIICALGLTLPLFGAHTFAAPVKNQVVLLKFDDLTVQSHAAFQRTADLLKEENVPGCFGIIGNSLEGDNPDYVNAIKAWDAQGIEIWHHGYTSGEKEYLNDDYDAQYESFKKTMDLVKEKCGITMHSFCLPWGNGTDTTLKMLNDFPEITSTIVAPKANEIANAVSFDRQVRLETTTGNTSYTNFVEQFRISADTPYMVIQCHVGMWKDSSFDELRQAIAYLKEKGCRFTTPTAYVEEYRQYLDNPPAEDENAIYVRLDKEYVLDFDVEPCMINDRVMVPFRSIFSKLGAQVSWDEATATATAVKGDTTVKITPDSPTAYINGREATLDVAATIINDRFVVPIRFVSEALGAVVYWAHEENTVVIRTVKDGCSYTLAEGQLPIISSSWNKAYTDEIGMMSYDGDTDSVWSAEGTDVWVCYDLGQIYGVDKVSIMWNKGDARQAKYEILISDDGESFTSILDSLSSGTAANSYEDTSINASARYVKVLCKGNVANGKDGTWNAIKEIKFFGK